MMNSLDREISITALRGIFIVVNHGEPLSAKSFERLVDKILAVGTRIESKDIDLLLEKITVEQYEVLLHRWMQVELQLYATTEEKVKYLMLLGHILLNYTLKGIDQKTNLTFRPQASSVWQVITSV
jgi:hypothetical protein